MSANCITHALNICCMYLFPKIPQYVSLIEETPDMTTPPAQECNIPPVEARAGTAFPALASNGGISL